MKGGGERRARCGEAEAGARFIGQGRWWRGGETADGGGASMLRPLREMGRRAPVSGVKGERRR
jgi:hypothetical protein